MNDIDSMEVESAPPSREEKREFQEKMSRWKALMRNEEDRRKTPVAVASDTTDDKVA